MNVMVHYCTFSNKGDTAPRARQEPWEAFVKRLTTHTIRRCKDGRLWSPTTYPNGKTRCKDAVEAVTMAVGDMDHGATFEEIENLLEPYEYVAHSTHSHAPASPRFRVVIPFAQSVPARDWTDIGERIQEHVFGQAADTSSSDACRAYYFPSCPPDAKNWRFAKHHLGAPLDAPSLPPASKSMVHASSDIPGQDTTTPKVPLGKRALDFVANGAPVGQQRARAIAAARNYLSAGYSEKDTAEAIWRGLQVSPQDPARGPWTKDDAVAIVLDLASKPAPPLPDPKKKPLAPLTLVRLADVQPESVKWLWEPYIPLGKLTLLEGDPGVGKSWVSLAIATAVSLGRGLPGVATTIPANVLVLTAEDGLGDTVRPRLDGMGADVSRIFALEGPLVLEEAGLAEMGNHIAETRAVLVIYDPLVAYLGAGMDLHRSNETRAVMAALAALAERNRCAIVTIRHLTKGEKGRAIYRGLGSIDLTAACRSVLLAGCDPEDPQKRAIVQIKNNLAAMGEAVGYSVEDGHFFWTGVSDLTAARILAPDSSEDGKSALEEAVDFLHDALAAGERPVAEVQREAKSAGVQERTLDRAKAQLGIRARRRGETGKRGGGVWYWALPSVPGDLESQNDLECQDSYVENLALLIDSERKHPSSAPEVGILNPPAPPTPAPAPVKCTPFDDGPGGPWEEAVK